MRRRDRQNELVVALVVAIAMAFALAFSILLSLGDDDDDTPDSNTPIAVTTEEATWLPFTEEPTEEIAEDPTNLPTDIPSETLTEVPTEEPTEQPTEETTEEVTEEVIEVATQEATQEATEPDDMQIEETASPMVIALDITEFPTEEASPTDTPTRTPSATETIEDTDTPTPTSTDTDTPSPTSTDTPSPTATFTETDTATPTITLTDTPTLTLTPFGRPRTLVPTLTPTATQIGVAQVQTLAVTIVIPTRGVISTPTPTEETAATCVPRSDWDIYIIDIGDTLFSIARAAGVTIAELQAGNCLENTGLIYAGQPLRVPRGSSLPVTESSDAAIEGCNIPNAVLTAPKTGEPLSGFVTLRGIASGEGFHRYILDWRPDDPNIDYTSFEEIFKAVPQDGDLGRFNSDAFPAGLYWFRLRVLETNDFIIGECAIRVRFD